MNRKNILYTISIICLIIIIIIIYNGVNEQFDLIIDNKRFYGDFNKSCKECTLNNINNTLSCSCNNQSRSSLLINDVNNSPNITNKDNKLALSDIQYRKLTHISGKCLRPSQNSFNSGIVFGDCDGPNSEFMFLSNGALLHKGSQLCVHPYGGRARNNGHLVLGDNCWQHGFKQLPSGSIQNLQSGMCIHPLGGSQNPNDGTLSVLHSGCGSFVDPNANRTIFKQ
jgi:hypothetical protein